MENKNSKELIITRIFDAPVGLVWKTWIEAEHLKRWWGPTACTVPVCESDARPGGVILFHMQTPDGTIYIMSGTYSEVVKHERLVFTSRSSDAAGKMFFDLLNTVLFKESQGKTKITIRLEVLNNVQEAAPYLAAMSTGINQGLDKLCNYLNGLK